MEFTAVQRVGRQRVEELFREVGTLLLAFTPLDASLSADRGFRWQSLLLFVPVGLFLFVIAVLSERRRLHVDS